VRTLLFAGGIALAVSLVGTRFLMDWLTRHNIGQPIHEDVPEGHLTKAGTPTMGGLAIVVGAVAGYVISDLSGSRIITRSGLLAMAAIVGAGLVGLVDDYLKVSRERNLGLNKRAKISGLLVVAVGFAVLAIYHTPVSTMVSLTRFDNFDIDMGRLGWGVLAVLLILGATNAVNLTDGLDGLAGGSAVFAFMAFTIIGFWQFRHFETYGVEHALDLAVVAAAMAGACTGFLWWNAAPARIIMGDTGSLALGAGLAALALFTHTVLLLVVIGGIFVLETLSVIIQVTTFRLFGRRRVFRMAPIHHHFELGGWPETTVIIRFWIIAGLLTAIALGFFYADFINTGGID
jgi:phospho-N-acetylmuramoyl-pentapeptide-transferase